MFGSIRGTGWRFPQDIEAKRSSPALILATVFLVGVLARLPALEAWWCLDDWSQIGRAAGLSESQGGWPARWLSQHFWWTITWPLLGMQASAHAASRLILHALAAVTLCRIARQAGLTSLHSLIAGLWFAASPMAFTPLFWASGIQELLAGLLALLAVERWLAGGSRAIVTAGLCAAGSILAKESGLGLPIFLLALSVWGHRCGQPVSRLRWLVVALLSGLAGWECLLVAQNFASGPLDPYRLGGFWVIVGNLGKFGWWLATPGPVFTGQVTWPMAWGGVGLFLLWGGWGLWAFRGGKRLPLLAWAAALLSLFPALPLVNQARPYMGYVACGAGILALVSLLPARWPLRWIPGLALVIVALAWGNVGMRLRIAATDNNGYPADPVVRATQFAKEAAELIQDELQKKPRTSSTRLVFFQQPLLRETADRADLLGQEAVEESARYVALGGTLGASLVAGSQVNVKWVNSLLTIDPDALVFWETGRGIEAWGPAWDALLYASLVDMSAGNFTNAAREILQAVQWNDDLGGFDFDSKLLGLPESLIRKRGLKFFAWISSPEVKRLLSPQDETMLKKGTLDLLAKIAQSDPPVSS